MQVKIERSAEILSDLKKGDIYTLPKGETVYMILSPDHYIDEDNTGRIVSVGMNTGKLYKYEPERKIIKMTGEMIAKIDKATEE